EHEHEQVVDGQTILGNVAGKKFNAMIATPDQRQSTAKEDGQRHKKDRPGTSLSKRRLMRLADMGDETKRKQRNNTDNRRQPDPYWHLHPLLLLIVADAPWGCVTLCPV